MTTTEKDRQFVRHTVVFGIGTILIPVAGMVLLPLYTSCFSPEEMGLLEIVNRIAEVIGLCVLSSGIQQATQAFYLQATDERRKDSLVATMLAIFLAALLIGSVIFVPLLCLTHRFFGVDHPSALLAGVGSYLLLVSLEIPFTVMRARMESIRYVIVSVLLFLLRISVTICAVALWHGGVWGVWGATAAVGGVFVICLYARELRLGALRVDFVQAREILRFALPLVPGGLLMFLLFNADRFLLVWFHDKAEVGIYATGYKIASAVAMCSATPLLRVWAVYQFDWLHRENGAKICATWMNRMVFLQSVIGLGLSVFCIDLLRFIAKESYFPAARIVGPIVLAELFLNATYMLEGVFYVFRRTRLKLYVNCFATLITLVLYFVLIPRYGMAGAAWGTVVGYAALFLGTCMLSRSVMRIALHWRNMLAIVLSAVLVAWIASELEPRFGFGLKPVLLMVWVAACLPMSGFSLRRFLSATKKP